jgi:hypothetical protein
MIVSKRYAILWRNGDRSARLPKLTQSLHVWAEQLARVNVISQTIGASTEHTTPAGEDFDPHHSVKLLSQAALDEPRPEATPGRLLNVRPLRLLPHEVQPLWLTRAVQRPMYPNLAGTVGQGPVLQAGTSGKCATDGLAKVKAKLA